MSNRALLSTVTVLAAAFVLALASCFSERSSGTGPQPTGDCNVPLSPDVLGSTLVVMQNFAFLPAEIRVRRGTRVTWLNCEPATAAPHTATADGGAFSSPLISTSGTYTRTFDQVGTFPYHCAPHPFMTGRVIVE